MGLSKQIEPPAPPLFLSSVTATDDQAVRLSAPFPCPLAFGRFAPGRDWMSTARGPTLTAAVRMIDWVHGDAAN